MPRRVHLARRPFAAFAFLVLAAEGCKGRNCQLHYALFSCRRRRALTAAWGRVHVPGPFDEPRRIRRMRRTDLLPLPMTPPSSSLKLHVLDFFRANACVWCLVGWTCAGQRHDGRGRSAEGRTSVENCHHLECNILGTGLSAWGRSSALQERMDLLEQIWERRVRFGTSSWSFPHLCT